MAEPVGKRIPICAERGALVYIDAYMVFNEVMIKA